MSNAINSYFISNFINTSEFSINFNNISISTL